MHAREGAIGFHEKHCPALSVEILDNVPEKYAFLGLFTKALPKLIFKTLKTCITLVV
jgi:hypothetical protein